MEKEVEVRQLWQLSSVKENVSAGWRQEYQSTSLKTEFYRHSNAVQNSFKGYFSSGDLKVETWVCNLYLESIDCISIYMMSQYTVTLPKMTSLSWGQKILRSEFNLKSWRFLVCVGTSLPASGRVRYDYSDSLCYYTPLRIRVFSTCFYQIK